MSDDKSFIGVTERGCTSFVGPDAVNYVRAIHLWGALRLWAKTKMIPTRGVTITSMLAMATAYTGKTYKRSQALQAAEDVKAWADEMKAALPKIDESTGEPV